MQYRGDAGVAHAPQNGGQGVVKEDKEEARAADGQIAGGLVQGGGLEQYEQGPAQQDYQRGEEQAQQQAQRQQVSGGLPAVFPVAGAEILPHQDVAAHGQADGHLGQHIHDHAAIVDGGDAHVPNKMSGHDDVGDAVGGLEQAGGHQRQGIPHQLSCDAAAGQIVYQGRHETTPSFPRLRVFPYDPTVYPRRRTTAILIFWSVTRIGGEEGIRFCFHARPSCCRCLRAYFPKGQTG